MQGIQHRELRTARYHLEALSVHHVQDNQWVHIVKALGAIKHALLMETALTEARERVEAEFSA